MPAVGHGGGGLGAGCQLYNILQKEVYFFLAINLGTVTESPIHEQVSKPLKNYKLLFSGMGMNEK